MTRHIHTLTNYPGSRYYQFSEYKDCDSFAKMWHGKIDIEQIGKRTVYIVIL